MATQPNTTNTTNKQVVQKTKTINRKLSKKERNYIAFCEIYYFKSNASFPTPEEAATALNYHVYEIQNFLGNIQVQKALDRRGLPWQKVGEWGDINPTKVAAAMLVTNFADMRQIDEKLDAIGVSPSQYNAWLQDPTFRDFVNNLADKNMNNVRPEAMTAFAQKVRSGDLKALQMFFDYTGQFEKQDSPDMHKIIGLFIEVVQRHIKDPSTLIAIATDLRKVAQIESKPDQNRQHKVIEANSTNSTNPANYTRENSLTAAFRELNT